MRRSRSALLTPELKGRSGVSRETSGERRGRTARTRSDMQIQVLEARLKEMEFEVSNIRREVHETRSEQGTVVLRYGRRLVIFTNVLLGSWLFALSFVGTVRRRQISKGFLARLLLNKTIQQAEEGLKRGVSTPVSAVLFSGILEGLQRGWLFFIAASLHTFSVTAAKRDLGFHFSVWYSLYLDLAVKLRPRFANRSNILFQLAYAFARYYYLHGLLDYGHMRIR